MEIKTLEKTRIEEITRTFNLSFSDYYLPIKFTKEQFELKFKSEGVRLDLSVGVFEKGSLIGFILHFMNTIDDKICIYNGGTGLIPKFRGMGISGKMYNYILPILKKNHVDSMILEVLCQNTSAINLYEKQGFEIKRKLHCFKGPLILRKAKQLPRDYEMIHLDEMDWNALQPFWDAPPTWQFSIYTMNILKKNNLCYGIKKGAEVVAYIIYDRANRRIHHLAVNKNHRKLGLATFLINKISQIENQDISCLNIDSKIKNIKKFLESLGLKNIFDQYEMELTLSKR